MVDVENLFVMYDSRGVIDVAVVVHKAHDSGDALRGFFYLFKGLKVCGDKAGFQEQVLGRVAGDCEFGKCHEFGPGFFGLADA